MKFNTLTKSFAILNALIIQIAYCLSASKNKMTYSDRSNYEAEVDSERKSKRSRPEVFKPIYAPMILAGDAANEMKIQSFGTFYTKKMFSPRDGPEAEGWFFKLGINPQIILSKVMLHSRRNFWYIPYNYFTSDIVYRKENATNSYFEGILTNKNAEKVHLRINVNHNSKTRVVSDEIALKIVDFINKRRVYNKPEIAQFYMEYSKTLNLHSPNNPHAPNMPGAANNKNNPLNPLNNNKNNPLAPNGKNNNLPGANNKNNPLNPGNLKSNIPGSNNPNKLNPAGGSNPLAPGSNNPNRVNPAGGSNPLSPGSNNPNKVNPAGGNNPLNPNPLAPGSNNPNKVNPAGGNNPLAPGSNNPNKVNPAGGNNPLNPNPLAPGSNNPNKVNPAGGNNPLSPGSNNPNKVNPAGGSNPLAPGSNNPNKVNPAGGYNPLSPGSNNPNKVNPAGGNNPLNPNPLSPGSNNPNKVNPAGGSNPLAPGSNNPNKANPAGGSNPLNPNPLSPGSKNPNKVNPAGGNNPLAPGSNNPNKVNLSGRNNPNKSNIPGAATSKKTNGLPNRKNNKKNNPLNIPMLLPEPQVHLTGLTDASKYGHLNQVAYPEAKEIPIHPVNPNNPINNGKSDLLSNHPDDRTKSTKHHKDPSKKHDDPLIPGHPNTNKKNNKKMNSKKNNSNDKISSLDGKNHPSGINDSKDSDPLNPNNPNKSDIHPNKRGSTDSTSPKKENASLLKVENNGDIIAVPNSSSNKNQFDDKNATKVPIGGFIHYNEQRKDTGEFVTRIVIKPDPSKSHDDKNNIATGGSGNHSGNGSGSGSGNGADSGTGDHHLDAKNDISGDIESPGGLEKKTIDLKSDSVGAMVDAVKNNSHFLSDRVHI